MPPSKTIDLPVGHLEKTLLALIVRTAWDIPADVDKAIHRAVKAEEPGTNGHAALEEIVQAIDTARASKSILGSDPVSLHFTVDGPPGLDPAPWRAAALGAAHEAAVEGWIRTPMIDLPNGKPRRGKDLGVIPTIRIREAGDAIRVHLWMRGPAEGAIASAAAIPSPIAMGEPTIEGAGKVAVHAIHEVQGRAGGPGLVGIHVGADPLDGFLLAADQILRPIGIKNPQRPLSKVEEKVTDDTNSLGIGPQGLGGRTTILAAHLGASEVPKDRWTVSVVMAGWACRRQSVTLGKDGTIQSWDTALAESSYRTPIEIEPPEEPAPKKKAAKKKKAAAKPVAESEPKSDPEPQKKSAAPAAKKATKTTAKKTTAEKSTAKKSTAKKTTKSSKRS